ncbi:MAG: argininosuccinate synthase, partial [Actinomycetes bacterium]
LDTSVAVAWLREQHGAEVITLTVDVGGGSIREGVERRAMSAGASKAYVVDAKETFVSQYVWRALQAGAVYQGAYPLATALARPLLAQLLVEVAQREGADAVAHGCTGKGNDQVRFDVAVHALDPGLEVVAPVRDSAMSRPEAISYADKHGLDLGGITEAKPWSIDQNLWGRTIEAGVLEDPWLAPPSDAFEWTVSPATASGTSELVVGFEAGVPTTVDGAELGMAGVVAALNRAGGQAGFGRVDMMENRRVGIKSREVYEVPGALAAIAAHRDLEDLTLDRDVLHEKARLDIRYAELVYDGLWFSPLKAALDAFVVQTQAAVTGEVRLELSPGRCQPTGRRAERALYRPDLATYEAGDAFDHDAGRGFVSLWGLPARTWARVHGDG